VKEIGMANYNDDLVNEKSYWEKGYAVFRGIFNTEEVAGLHGIYSVEKQCKIDLLGLYSNKVQKFKV
jgi:hypothetical protein